MKEFVFKLQNF